jgi:hypothetical protein
MVGQCARQGHRLQCMQAHLPARQRPPPSSLPTCVPTCLLGYASMACITLPSFSSSAMMLRPCRTLQGSTCTACQLPACHHVAAACMPSRGCCVYYLQVAHCAAAGCSHGLVHLVPPPGPGLGPPLGAQPEPHRQPTLAASITSKPEKQIRDLSQQQLK